MWFINAPWEWPPVWLGKITEVRKMRQSNDDYTQWRVREAAARVKKRCNKLVNRPGQIQPVCEDYNWGRIQEVNGKPSTIQDAAKIQLQQQLENANKWWQWNKPSNIYPQPQFWHGKVSGNAVLKPDWSVSIENGNWDYDPPMLH